MPVLDLTGRTYPPALRLEWAPSFESLMSLCAFCLPEEDVGTLDDGPSWAAQVSSSASRELLASIGRLGAHAGKAWVNFLGLAASPPPAVTPGQLIGRIEALSPLDVRLYLLGEHVPAYQGTLDREVLRRAAEGEGSAKARLLVDPTYFGGEADPILQPLLALGPEDTKDLALEVLRRWEDEVFAAWLPRVEPGLRMEASRHDALLRSEPVERAIEEICGVRFIPQREIHEVILIPQFAMRPWLLLCEHDKTRLFCYPAVDEAAHEEQGPPRRLLQLARALGDEKRLRILAAIGRGSSRVPQLSEEFGLPKSTTYHHLAILRSAGLVTVTSDLDRRYRIRPEGLQELRELMEALVTGTESMPGRDGGSP